MLTSCELSSGELRSAPLALLLIEGLRTKANGELEIGVPGGNSRLYLRNGHPCGVQVFFGFKPLGQFLLELGWIDLHGLERSLVAVADGRKQGEALVSLGLLSPEQLDEALRRLHQGHLSTLAELEEGSYRFAPTLDLPAWTDAIRLRAHRAIVDSMLSPPGRAVAERILREGLPGGERLRLRKGWERFAPHFELAPSESSFLTQLEAPQAVEGLGHGDLEAPHATALLATLLLMGVAVPHRDGQRSPGPAAELLDGAVPGERGKAAAPDRESVATQPRAAAAPPPRRSPPPLAPPVGSAQATVSAPPSQPAAVQTSAGDDAELEKRKREDEAAIRALVEERSPALESGDRFALLGVAKTASDQRIKQAYLRTVKIIHPDRLPAALEELRPTVEQLFSAVTEANEILSDPRRREAYLRERREEEEAGGEIRSADARQLVRKGEELLRQRRFSQALAFFMQALQIEDHPEIRAHAVWAANMDPRRKAAERAQSELERLAKRHPSCGQISHYLKQLDLRQSKGVS